MTDTITLPRAVIQDTVDAIERYQVKRQDFDRFAEVLPSLRAAIAQQAEQVPPTDKELFNIYCDDVNADDLYSYSSTSNYYAGFRMGWKMAAPKGGV